MNFYPATAPVPSELRTANLLLHPLGPEHVERDYDAFMSSRERLRIWSGGSWPSDDFTLAMNMDDMHHHRGEHVRREAFTYTVMSPDASVCQGCIYINGWEKFARQIQAQVPDFAEEYDGITSYWVRDSALAADLDKELLSGLIAWFAASWQFNRAVFVANIQQERDIACLTEAGLTRLATVEGQRYPGTFYIYG